MRCIDRWKGIFEGWQRYGELLYFALFLCVMELCCIVLDLRVVCISFLPFFVQVCDLECHEFWTGEHGHEELSVDRDRG